MANDMADAADAADAGPSATLAPFLVELVAKMSITRPDARATFYRNGAVHGWEGFHWGHADCVKILKDGQ